MKTPRAPGRRSNFKESGERSVSLLLGEGTFIKTRLDGPLADAGQIRSFIKILVWTQAVYYCLEICWSRLPLDMPCPLEIPNFSTIS